MQFLEHVISQKKAEIAQRKARVAVGDLEARAKEDLVRDFRSGLSGGQKIVAEVKKKSPKVTSFRQAGFADVLATLYERSGASAISVVTDEVNFGTSLTDAERIRRSVSLPVLVKDFVLDPYQVVEARAFGADALLLVTRILEPSALAELLEQTRALGMSALVEVHTKEDVDKALAAEADIIGINNRNLDTLEVSLDTTRDLIDTIPDDALVISESGIGQRDQIEELSSLGVDAFLIGGALLESEDPAQLLRTLLGRTAELQERTGRNA